jgi:hypothetical protein
VRLFSSGSWEDVPGIESVAAMIERAESNRVPKGLLLGSGYEQPSEDESFDAVFECGVLHHVAEPGPWVAEMIRVAKLVIFLSDSNRLGQGGQAARLLKIALWKCGLWRAASFAQTRGKMYAFSDGDGLAYSYGVFDSYDQLATGTLRIWILPIGTEPANRRSWIHPLLTSTHVLLCAVKETPSKG